MERFGLTITTAPSVEPLTTAEAKSRLRITVTDEDTDIGTLITQARELAESECGRAFVTQTLTVRYDDFPRSGDRAIYLPRPPLQSVTWVKYYDADGNQQTYSSASYHVATLAEPGRVVPVDGGVWPAIDFGRPEAVEVKCVCGYGLAASVPAAAKAAILVIMASLREDPTGTKGVPPAARRLLDTLEFGQVI